MLGTQESSEVSLASLSLPPIDGTRQRASSNGRAATGGDTSGLTLGRAGPDFGSITYDRH